MRAWRVPLNADPFDDMMKQRPQFPPAAAGIIACIAASSLHAVETRGHDLYQKQVLPVLQKFCYDCHADGMKKGDIELDTHKDYTGMLADRELWNDVREHVSTHVMPPDGKPAPTLDERDAIVKWIDDAVFYVDPAKTDPGHVTLRRLNRVEYNNTVRDIFRIDSRPAESFPPDDTGYGFDNIGDVLTLSPLLMEKYLRAARKVAEEAVWTKSPERIKKQMDGNNFWVAQGKGDVTKEAAILWINGELSTQVDVTEEGIYRLVVQLSADQSGNEKARYALRLDDKEIQQGEIAEVFDHEKPDDNLHRIAFDVALHPGKRKIGAQFLNDGGDPNAPDPRHRDRNLIVRSAEVAGPIKYRAAQQSKLLDWLFDGKRSDAPSLVLQADDFDMVAEAGGFWDDAATLATDGFIHRIVDIPTSAEYRVHIFASEDHAGKEFARMKVRLGSGDMGTYDVTTTAGKWQEITITRHLVAGSYDLRIEFINGEHIGSGFAEVEGDENAADGHRVTDTSRQHNGSAARPHRHPLPIRDS